MRSSSVLAALLCFTTWMCVVHAHHGPLANCLCLSWSSTKVKFENIVEYSIQSEDICPIAAVLFKTKEKKSICSHPDSPYTKRNIQKMDARVLQEKRQKEEGSMRKLESGAITDTPSVRPSTGCSAFPITTALGTVKGGVGTVTGGLRTVTGELGTVKGGLATVTGRVVTVTGSVGTVKGGVGTVTGELATVTGRLVTVTGGLGTVTGGLGTVKGSVRTVTAGLRTVKGGLATVAGGQGMVTGRVGTVKGSLGTITGGLGMTPADIRRGTGQNRERKTNAPRKRRFRRRRGQRTRCREGKKGQTRRLAGITRQI